MREDLRVEIRTGFAALAARQSLIGEIIEALGSPTLTPEEAQDLSRRAAEHQRCSRGLLRILEDELVALLSVYDESLTHMKVNCMKHFEALNRRMDEIEKARRIGPFKPSPIQPN